MFSSQILKENTTNTINIDNVVRNPSSDIEFNILEENTNMNNLYNENEEKIYKLLYEQHSGAEISVINEGIGDIISGIIKFIRKIIDGIADFFDSLFGISERKQKNIVEYAKKTNNFSTDFNERDFREACTQKEQKTKEKIDIDKQRSIAMQNCQNMKTQEYTFTVYNYPSAEAVESGSPKSAIATMVGYVEDICKGQPIGTEPNDGYLKIAYVALKKMTKGGSRKEYSGKVTNSEEYMKFIKTDVVYATKLNITYEKWRNEYATVSMNKYKNNKNFGKKMKELMTEELVKCEKMLSEAKEKETIDSEGIKYVNTFIKYIGDVVNAWKQYIKYLVATHNRNMDYIQSMHQRLMYRLYTSSSTGSIDMSESANIIDPINESSTMFGEPFEGDTLFDNEDTNDFNRTEWLDLSLTRECYNMEKAISDGQRRIALQEALIFTDDADHKIFRLQMMREAEERKIEINLTKIMETVKEIVNKFMNKMKDVMNDNSKYVEDNREAIMKPFKDDLKCSSKGNVIAGIYRVQDALKIDPYNSEMNEDLNDPKTFFDKRIKSSLNQHKDSDQREIKDQNASITEYCKAYYGAPMSEDKYPKCEYDASILNAHHKNIVEYVENTLKYVNTVRSDLDKIDEQVKAAAKLADQPQSSNTENKTSTSSDTESKEESYYSVLFDKVITEMDVQNGEVKDGENANKPASQSKLIKNYASVYKDIILSRITAAEFIASELVQLLEVHTGVKRKIIGNKVSNK